MRFELTGRNVSITPTIERRVKRLLAKLKRLLDDSANAHAIISVEKHRHRAEIVVNWHDKIFTGVAETPEIYTCVAQAIEKLERQVLRQKEKFAARRRLARRKSRIIPAAERLNAEPRIIRSVRYAIKPMTPEEAAVTLNRDDDRFLVFRDFESDRIAVLYKRADGHFGLIEP